MVERILRKLRRDDLVGETHGQKVQTLCIIFF